MSNRLPGQLWIAVKASGVAKDFSERADPSIYVCRGWDAFQLAGAVAADPAGGSEFGRSSSALAAELGLTMGGCGLMGSRAKLAKVAEDACSMEQIAQRAQAGAQLNVLENCGSSPRSAASGIRRWAFRCDLTGRPHFPPTEGGVLAWSSCFGAGRSCKIHVARLDKACLLLGVSTPWQSKAVLTAGHGLAQVGDRAHSPRPAVSKDQLSSWFQPTDGGTSCP